MIAFYYGLTGFACTWYYRHDLRNGTRDLVMKGLAPLLGGLMLVYSLIAPPFFRGQTLTPGRAPDQSHLPSGSHPYESPTQEAPQRPEDEDPPTR